MSDFDLPIGAIPSSWSVAELKEVTSKIGSGATPRGGAKVYRDEGTAFIRSQNVLDNEFSVRGLVHIDDDAADALSGVSVLPGDVLFNITGDSILRTCVVPDSVLPARVSQHVAIIRSNGSVDPLFLQKYLTIPAVKEYMLGHSAGGTRKAITKGHIEGFVVPLPPLPEQRAIAEVLGALDDKIESNRRIVELGVRLARLLVSQGESSVRLGDIATIQKGLSYKGSGLEESPEAGIPMVNLANFSTLGWMVPSGLKYYSGDHKGKHTLGPWDVVVANTDLTQQRSILGRAALVPPSLDGSIFTHHVNLIRFAESEENTMRLAVWGQLNSPAFRERAEGFATGTTVAGLPVDALLDFEMKMPRVDDVNAAELVLMGVWSAESESVRLEATRDALLPALLSGRIRVPAAAELVEAS